MKILGVTYSKQVDKLCKQLKKLAGDPPIIDDNLSTEGRYANAVGQYRIGSRPPHISVQAGVPEHVIVHELLHGVLDNSGYPGWVDRLRDRWKFETTIADVICHCVTHIVIDGRMQSLGYNVTDIKNKAALLRIGEMPSLRDKVEKEADDCRFSIRVACVMARYRRVPAAPQGTMSEFTATAAECFPEAERLATKLCEPLGEMNPADCRSVKACVWSMLDICEQHYESPSHLCDLRTKVVITPLHVTRRQMSAPAQDKVWIEAAQGGSDADPGVSHAIWLTDRGTGAPLGVIVCSGEDDNSTTVSKLKGSMTKPLWRFLDEWKCSHYKL